MLQTIYVQAYEYCNANINTHVPQRDRQKKHNLRKMYMYRWWQVHGVLLMIAGDVIIWEIQIKASHAGYVLLSNAEIQ